MAFIVVELYWLCMLFQELHIPLASALCLWVDNLGALALSSNPIFHACTKHIKVNYHFIMEKIFNKDIQADYISIAAQLSYIFTKGLTSTKFLLFREKMMVRALPTTEDVRHISFDKSAFHHDKSFDKSV